MKNKHKAALICFFLIGTSCFAISCAAAPIANNTSVNLTATQSNAESETNMYVADNIRHISMAGFRVEDARSINQALKLLSDNGILASDRIVFAETTHYSTFPDEDCLHITTDDQCNYYLYISYGVPTVIYREKVTNESIIWKVKFD